MIRGRISMISKGYAEASNTFVRSYDLNKGTSVIYLDANNLYGHSMMQLLSFEILDWDDPEKFNLDNHSGNGSIGCFSTSQS